MIFDIAPKPKSNVPIYEQIVAQVAFGIAAGDLKEGELIPSVRDLSTQLMVNPNTVARAYQDLEQLGIVAPKRGRGMEVTPEARQICRAYQQDIIRTRIREALREAASSSLPPEEIRHLVEQELDRVNGHRRARERT